MKNNLLTRNGVCKQLAYSPYNFTYIHKGKVVTLNFSSKLHLKTLQKIARKTTLCFIIIFISVSSLRWMSPSYQILTFTVKLKTVDATLTMMGKFTQA